MTENPPDQSLSPIAAVCCSICGGTRFEPGWAGRLGRGGQPPKCAQCGSVERHRFIAAVYTALTPLLANWRVLQFGPDKTIKPSACEKYDSSIYGGHNSLDMMDTGLQAGSYDLIVSTHVMEHVKDDRLALAECLRVVGPTGAVHVSVPTPAYRYTTIEWGYPDPTKAEHYRDYGTDAGRYLCRKVPGVHCLGVTGVDSVTGQIDHIFFFSRGETVLERISNTLHQDVFGCVVVA
jgi:SAM-dependent methyltransferase